MTFRTSKEGGEKAIEPEAYAKLNIKAAQTGYVDFVDVETVSYTHLRLKQKWRGKYSFKQHSL